MSLKEEERNIIVSMEMEKAEQTFAESEVLKNAGLWSNLANRLYKEMMLERFINSRPSTPTISEEDIMNEVRAVRYAK